MGGEAPGIPPGARGGRWEAAAPSCEAGRFFRNTVDALTAHIAVLDAAGMIVAVNAAWCRFAAANGYASPDYGAGRNYLAVCDAAGGPQSDGAADLARGIRDVLQQRREASSVVYACHSPEQQRWFLARVTRFLDNGLVYAVVAHEAITEQHHAEEALRASEERFRTIFLQAMDAMVIANDEGHYLNANPAACALYGVPDEASLLGRWIGDFVPPPQRDTVPALWRAFIAAGSQSGEFAICRADGTVRAVEYRAMANLQPGRHLAVLHDITERELAAAELADSQRQLAAARETERLRLARELHDTAVQQLLGISFQLAAYRDPAGEARPAAGTDATLADIRREVLATVDRLRGVIRELRPAGLEEFGLTAALQGYLSALRRERGAALPAIAIDLDHVGDDLPHPVALCLFRVTQEALQNALRHGEAREVVVTLLREGRTISLSVRDDGRGFRVPARLTTYTQIGHFGLAGMTERVKLVGGQFAIASEPGKGTTVSVQITLGGEGEDDDGTDPGAVGR